MLFTEPSGNSTDDWKHLCLSVAHGTIFLLLFLLFEYYYISQMFIYSVTKVFMLVEHWVMTFLE